MQKTSIAGFMLSANHRNGKLSFSRNCLEAFKLFLELARATGVKKVNVVAFNADDEILKLNDREKLPIIQMVSSQGLQLKFT